MHKVHMPCGLGGLARLLRLGSLAAGPVVPAGMQHTGHEQLLGCAAIPFVMPDPIAGPGGQFIQQGTAVR